MNTATFAATATRFQFTMPSGLLVALQRTMAPAASGGHGLDKGATTWIARPLGRTITCETGTPAMMAPAALSVVDPVDLRSRPVSTTPTRWRANMPS
jgi:hypothetical protein